LHRAIDRQELEVFFQPQMDVQSGRVLGFEALMRWRHPELGLVSPARFIPLAEDNGQIVPMGAWILRQACTTAAHWPQSLQLRVAVNLSARQFADPGLFAHVREALEKSGLPAPQLELEITEGTVMQDLQRTLDLLRRFKNMGVKLAIDDFGTGYSSLAYLKRFPLDVLKIDQSFVRQLCSDREDQAIANAVIQLAHSLGLRVIAEGVETAEQEALLRVMGCDDVQGYLYGKPMTLEDTREWLARRNAVS
jgi:EAL domain-containing protein (putative c-di-GMP-specific phosphodiesterase class I)